MKILKHKETGHKTSADPASVKWISKLKDYILLIKFTLSFMVVFSTVVSFLIAPYQQFFYAE